MAFRGGRSGSPSAGRGTRRRTNGPQETGHSAEVALLNATLRNHDRVIESMNNMLLRHEDTIKNMSDYMSLFHSQGVGIECKPPGANPNPRSTNPTAPNCNPNTTNPNDGTQGTNQNLERVEINHKGFERTKQFTGLQEDYIHWKEWVFEHVTKGRPEFGALLIWAQEQKTRITDRHEQEYALHNISVNTAFLGATSATAFLGATSATTCAPRS
jgi:hypothetical protein